MWNILSQRQNMSISEIDLKYRVVSIIGWIISYASEWEDYSNYLGEGVWLPRIGSLPISGLL